MNIQQYLESSAPSPFVFCNFTIQERFVPLAIEVSVLGRKGHDARFDLSLVEAVAVCLCAVSTNLSKTSERKSSM